MSTLVTPPDSVEKAPVATGWIVAGITFIVIWVPLHFVLMYLLYVGGFLLDLFLFFVKIVTLPGTVINSPGMEMAWVVPLTIGLVFAGVAGFPAGLAFFWRGRRLMLSAVFAGMFLIGVGFEIYAVYRLFADALPS